MNAKRRRFVAEFLVDSNGAAAARRAGYSARTARQMAAELLTFPDVAAAIAEGQRAQAERAAISADEVIRAAAAVVRADPRAIFRDGRLLRPEQWPAELAAAVSSIEISRTGVLRIRMWDKVAAVGLLMKHFGLLVERVVVEDQLDRGIDWLDAMPTERLERLHALGAAELDRLPLTNEERSELDALRQEAAHGPRPRQPEQPRAATVLSFEDRAVRAGRRRR